MFDPPVQSPFIPNAGTASASIDLTASHTKGSIDLMIDNPGVFTGTTVNLQFSPDNVNWFNYSVDGAASPNLVSAVPLRMICKSIPCHGWMRFFSNAAEGSQRNFTIYAVKHEFK